MHPLLHDIFYLYKFHTMYAIQIHTVHRWHAGHNVRCDATGYIMCNTYWLFSQVHYREYGGYKCIQLIDTTLPFSQPNVTVQVNVLMTAHIVMGIFSLVESVLGS